ncbi:hypothetical protein IFM89_035081 [Coptis chinensis]|uniref:Two-component response regulator n=1 Tax=Coptis chinensis TaxID=261450 RepID=A0A835M821_9MAGN|nr:hypothetical protein IFM89_035081 [Coptis chinensis]
MNVDEVILKKSRRNCFSAGIRVLAVDSDPTCRHVVEIMLKKCEYEVVAVSGAQDALDLLHETQGGFHLVLTDIHMFGINGFQLLEIVKREFKIPVIFMSADENPNLVNRAIGCGALFLLPKPLLLDYIQNLWQHLYCNNPEYYKFILDPQVNLGLEYSFPDSEENQRSDDGKRKMNNDEEGRDQLPTKQNKFRVCWTPELHKKFLAALNTLGLNRAVPKRILELMKVEGLSRGNIASHLQKYRSYLSRVSRDTTENDSDEDNSTGYASSDEDPAIMNTPQENQVEVGQGAYTSPPRMADESLINQQHVGGNPLYGLDAAPSRGSHLSILQTMIQQANLVTQQFLPKTTIEQNYWNLNLQSQDNSAANGSVGVEDVGSFGTWNQAKEFNAPENNYSVENNNVWFEMHPGEVNQMGLNGDDETENNDNSNRDQVGKGKRPMEMEESPPAPQGGPTTTDFMNPFQFQTVPTTQIVEQQRQQHVEPELGGSWHELLQTATSACDFTSLFFNEEDLAVNQACLKPNTLLYVD